MERVIRSGRRDGRWRRALLSWLVLSLVLLSPLQRVPAAVQQGCAPGAEMSASLAEKTGGMHEACCYKHEACGELCHDVCSGMSVPAMLTQGTVPFAAIVLSAVFIYQSSSKDIPPVPLNPPPISILA